MKTRLLWRASLIAFPEPLKRDPLPRAGQSASTTFRICAAWCSRPTTRPMASISILMTVVITWRGPIAARTISTRLTGRACGAGTMRAARRESRTIWRRWIWAALIRRPRRRRRRRSAPSSTPTAQGVGLHRSANQDQSAEPAVRGAVLTNPADPKVMAVHAPHVQAAAEARERERRQW
jgi:hypothetical protein